MVICSELPTNEGASVTNIAEQLAAEGIRYHRLPTPIVWIEHHPPLSTAGDTETFDLVTFSSYEVRERGPYLGETRLTVGEATWKRITRGMVEVLVGVEVLRRCPTSPVPRPHRRGRGRGRRVKGNIGMAPPRSPPYPGAMNPR